MAISFEEIVSALCAQVTPQHPNDFQLIYMIADYKEARLAYDVLVAHGFDAKVYHDDAHASSKLYITPPPADAPPADAKMAAALAYARGLAALQRDANALYNDSAAVIGAFDVNMTLASLPGGGKQVVIQFAAPAAAPRPAASAAAPVASVSQNVAPAKGYKGKKPKEEVFGAGPSLGKRYYPGKLDAKAKVEQNSPLRQIWLMITGNMATGLFGALTAGMVLAIILTVVIFFKGLLCPDFAESQQKRNHAWYCEESQEEQMTR